MTLERRLQISVATMAVLGTLLFGMGQQNLELPLICAFVAITSVIFTDVLKTFYLHRGVANLLAILVAVYTLWSFVEAVRDRKPELVLLAIANLQAYLQFVLFYEQKTPRVYSQIMVLSLLQVVVAAALDFDLNGALLLLLYFLAAISSLTLFYFFQEEQRVLSTDSGPADDASDKPGEGAGTYKPVLAPQPVASSFYGTSGSRMATSIPWKNLVHQLGALALAAIILMLVLFYATPRRGGAVWIGPTAVQQHVGFDDQVDLGEEEEIFDSNEPVMRVQFVDEESGEPYEVNAEPYFRGAVLTEYDTEAGEWHEISKHIRPENSGLRREPDWSTTQLVRQDVVLQRRGIKLLRESELAMLFGVFPYRGTEHTSGYVWYDKHRRRLFSPADAGRVRGNGIRYSVATTGFANGWQLPATPYRDDVNRTGDDEDLVEMRPNERRRLLMFDERRFPTLNQLADEIVRDPRVDSTNRVEVANALDRYFRMSGSYAHTLDFRTVERDTKLDPIEDFVRNHHRGHCEYFASALALMLRSQGIPSRLVSGYKGELYNSVGDYFQILQSDAHVWVEAYLEPDQITLAMLGAQQTGGGGAWLRLDPTPSNSDVKTKIRVTLMMRINHTLAYAHVLWSDYVLGLNRERQVRAIYDPLTAQPDDSLETQGEGRSAQEIPSDEIGSNDGLLDRLSLTKTQLGWIASGVALLTCVGFILMYRSGSGGMADQQRPGGRELLQRLIGFVAPWLAPQQRLRPRIDFYDRLVSLLARHGLRRSAGQTQREFASAVRQQLTLVPARRHVAEVAPRVIESYYQVRFGETELDAGRRRAIDQDLDSLRQALAVGNGSDSSEGEKE